MNYDHEPDTPIVGVVVLVIAILILLVFVKKMVEC